MTFTSRHTAVIGGLLGAIVSISVSGCSTEVSNSYSAEAVVVYTWHVNYIDEMREQRFRVQKFASTSLVNRNGERPDDAVTGPDDKGLWWPELPPRPTVDELEARMKDSERMEPPQLIKSVEYAVTFTSNGQNKTLPTEYSVYRQVVKAIPNQTPLEFVLAPDERSVTQAKTSSN
jgi:hypothetical protein